MPCGSFRVSGLWMPLPLLNHLLGHVHGHHKVSQFRAYGFHHMPPTRHRGSRGNDPVVYCPCTSLRHRTTGSAFPFYTDGAIFRSLSLRPVILQDFNLHTVHHWAACDACYPDKQVVSEPNLHGLVIYHPWHAILHGTMASESLRLIEYCLKGSLYPFSLITVEILELLCIAYDV